MTAIMNSNSDNPLDDLQGMNLGRKVLAIMVMSPSGPYSNVLKNIRFELQFGRVFIVGDPVPIPRDNITMAGCSIALAWDQVCEYIAFESVEDFYRHAGVQEPKRGWFS